MLSINPSISIPIEIFIFLILGSLTLFSAQDSLPPSHLSSDYWIYSGNKEVQLLPCDKEILKSGVNTSNHPARNSFWEMGTPFYQWQKLMGTLSDSYPHRRNGGRMAHFFGGLHDALQLTYSHLPDSLTQPIRLLPKNQHIQYQLASIVSAETASRILNFYFPEGQKEIQDLYQSHLTYIEKFPLDSCLSAIGKEIGQEVATEVIQRAKNDRTRSSEKAEFKNTESGSWYGTPSIKDYAKRQWRPFVLDHPSQLRCDPPPSSWEKDMEELRQFNLNHTHSDIAWKWKSIPVWDQWLDQLVFEYQLDMAPLKAASIYATFHIARYEATLSAWEAKYHYMGIRPFQYDTTFQPLLIHTPNFPGYPAGHTTVAGALAEVISYFFPNRKQQAMNLARECSASRFEGGVHFRTDNEVGLRQGKRVGQAVIRYITQ